ncbi:MAG: molybdopterin-dependent oxidoreductase [Chloroflexi bacterium]|nr:molybdopterin-dependent oxidoreductase [Chloroflexota bacterium]
MEPAVNEKVVLTCCTQDCGGKCPLKVYVKGGRITRVETHDGEEPQLRACLKGRAVRQRLYSPERLQYPMKRVGGRGEGRFERVSWDEALDKVASELKRIKRQYGNSTIFFDGGGANAAFHGRRAGYRLLNLFGGCTVIAGDVSGGCSIFASMTSYGTMYTGNTRDDLVNSRLIIMWGWNPATSIWDTNTNYYLIKAKEAGAELVCLDPRFTDTAAVIANQWIPVVPGSDCAALIAMANVIIKENLQDQKFLDRYTIGFDRYRDYVLGREDGIDKTPEWAEPVTGVKAGVIAELARKYATMKPAALIAGWAPGRTGHGEQYHRAAIALAAMTGNIGIHGGNAPGFERSYPSYGVLRGLPVEKNPVEAGAPPRKHALPVRGGINPTSARIHHCQIYDAILEGEAGGFPTDIKMGYFMGCNHLNQFPNANKGVQALNKLEFIVVHELFMTATARFADILLPINTQFERNDVAAPWLSAPYYVAVNQAIEPLYESRTDLEICVELAPRLGITNFNDKTEEEWLKWTAGGTGEVPPYDEFKKEWVHRVKLPEPYISFQKQIEDPEHNPFPTPSGKIEIYSQMLADLNIPYAPPLPMYFDTWESRSDPLAKKYPLQLINEHYRMQVHSGFGNVPWLTELQKMTIWINAGDAAARGISDGDSVRVFNDRGEVVVTAKVTEKIMPGVVCLPEGGPYLPDAKGVDRGGCVNVLTKEGASPGEGAMFNTALVQVARDSG